MRRRLLTFAIVVWLAVGLILLLFPGKAGSLPIIGLIITAALAELYFEHKE